MNFTFRDKTVTREFRLALAQALPGLGDNKSYWRFLSYLLFGTYTNDEGHLLLAREVVAAMEDKVADQHYKALRFIDQFRENVIGFEIEDYVLHFDKDQRRVRTLKSLRLPAEVDAVVKAERRSKGSDRVYMSTGNVCLRKHMSAARKVDREEAEQRALDKYIAPQTALLLGYMNSLPPNRFTSALRHLPEAIEAAEKLTDAENQLNLLHAIREHCQPFYIPAEATSRVFALGGSINGLHHDLRAIMSQDWMTADLKSAQLAIVARVWGIPELDEYLSSGRKVWPELTAQIGLPFTPFGKKIVKDALYAAVYGAGEERMISDLASALMDTRLNGEQAFRDLKKHPVVKTLLSARKRQLAKIRGEKGGTDSFGRVFTLQYRNVPGKQFQYDNSRSILASISQSYELSILMPILELALGQQFQSHGFTVVQWLHDGVSFDVHDKADLKEWLQRLATLVKDQADSLGINTELEFSRYGE